MFRIFIFLFLALAAVCPALQAAEIGTRDEAVAMVKRVQEKFRTAGPDATFKAITAKTKEFHDRDLYPYIYSLQGVVMGHGGRAELVGKNLIDFKDENGKFVIREMVELAQTTGSGWVDYRWTNPITHRVEDKSAYVEKIGNNFVGVGVYKTGQVNDNTIGIISGGMDDTYLQIASDLAAVLNDGDNFRMLPIVGIGGSQNIRDVLKLKGVDIGLVQVSILNSFRGSDETLGVNENRIVYIAKLFNEEIHVLAAPEIRTLQDLQGRKVNLNENGSGTNYVLRDVFKRLGVKIEEVNTTQADAIEMLKRGEIAATGVIAGKPSRFITGVRAGGGLHLLPIPYSKELSADYLPAKLTAEDYPDLIQPGKTVPVVADGVVLIAYNWPRTHDRYRRVQKFVQAFFPRIDEFQKSSRHAKWRDVNIASELSGWPRFEPASAWLAADRAKAPPDLRARFAEFIATIPSTEGKGALSQAEEDRLFKSFLEWVKSKDTAVTVPR